MRKLFLALLVGTTALIQGGHAQVPTQEQLQTADAQLNQVYQQLRGSLNDAQKQELKQAQRDWIKKRDVFVAANPENPQGALYQATIQRTAQLRVFLGGKQSPPAQSAVGNKINPKYTQQEKVVSEAEHNIISTQDVQSNQKPETKTNTNNVIIALQKPHIFESETKAAALNIIFLKKNNLLVTYCKGRDLGTTELKIWERATGKCLRTIDLNNDFKWIFPASGENTLTAIAAGSKIRCAESVSIDVYSGEDITKYVPQQPYEHLADGSVRRKYLKIAPFNQDIGLRQGICGNAFWTLQTPYFEGASRDKLKQDQEIEISIYAPEININCNLSVKSIISSWGGNELSINDISAIYPLDATTFLLLIKDGAAGVFVGTKGVARSLDRSAIQTIRENKKLPTSYYAINYNIDKGSMLSSDPNSTVILKSEGGRILASTTADTKGPLVVGLTDSESTLPIQVSVSSGAEKLVVSLKSILSGIDLKTGHKDFSITSSRDKIFDNPILSPSSDNLYWTEIDKVSNYPNGASDPFWYEKTGSRETTKRGNVCSARWSKPMEHKTLLENSVHQGFSPDLSKTVFLSSSNEISSINLDKQAFQTNRFLMEAPSMFHAGLSKDATWIIQLGFSETSQRGLYSLSTNDSSPVMVFPMSDFIEKEDIVDGTTSISDLVFSKSGSYLALINSKYRGAVLLSTNVNNCPKIFSVEGITSARWVDNEKFYMTSQTGVAIVSSLGKVLSSWNLPNSKAAEGSHKWSGPDSWAYDSQSRNFFFAASDGAVHSIKHSTDDSLEEQYHILLVDNGNPIFITPENYYATHAPKVTDIAFTQGVHSYPLEQFDLRLNRPDIVLERLGAPKEAIETAKSLRDKRLKRMGVTEEMLKPDFHIPELQIVGDVPATTPKDQLDLQIKATDDKYPLDRLRVYVNNVPVNGRDGELLRDQKIQNLEKTIPIKLAAGRNKIQVSVLNSAGAESLYANAEVNCTAERPKPKLYAVAMGVSQYDRPEWCLKYAAKDATDLIGKLKEKASTSYSEVKPLLLTDKEVTKESAAKIKEFLSGATIDDTVLIFMAGHGLLDDKYDYYFGTTDIDPAKPSERGMPYEAIDNILAEVPSLKKALLMDTCHAGELDDDEKKDLAASDGSATPGGIPAAATNSSPMAGKVAMRAIGTRGMSVKAIQGAKGKSDWYEKLQDMFVDLRRGSGATVISSSQGAEYAFESSEQSNGLFTYSLMEALDGKGIPNKDGQITISSIGDYVKKRVQDLTKGKQNPNLRGVNLEEDFALSSTK
jgi:hypothetical protein